MDDRDREIVRTASALAARNVDPTPQVIAEWLRMAFGDAERRMANLRMLAQLPEALP